MNPRLGDWYDLPEVTPWLAIGNIVMPGSKPMSVWLQSCGGNLSSMPFLQGMGLWSPSHGSLGEWLGIPPRSLRFQQKPRVKWPSRGWHQHSLSPLLSGSGFPATTEWRFMGQATPKIPLAFPSLKRREAEHGACSTKSCDSRTSDPRTARELSTMHSIPLYHLPWVVCPAPRRLELGNAYGWRLRSPTSHPVENALMNGPARPLLDSSLEKNLTTLLDSWLHY